MEERSLAGGGVPAGSAQMIESQSPDQRSAVRVIFAILLCAGFVYVVFFFFLMFRTVLFPDLFPS